jgi:hypothetical protein
LIVIHPAHIELSNKSEWKEGEFLEAP